ncbi:MAG: hypothetical protein A2W00_14845 [Candidatus Eisenbacteria bacterium RBG_16_71_46]|nr:MAG: hypothetical protein A2W00_14845 [Candidatus Eisenbacteria bacterium RBG_16_71_46]
MRSGRRAACAIALAGAAALALPACAPHRLAPPALEEGQVRARFVRALAERAERARAVEARVALWPHSASRGALPGAEAVLLLAAPDAFRLRVGSSFGTALDLGAHDDSVVAYVPSRRLAVRLGAAGESLGVRSPAAVVCRALGATWNPDAAAWAAPERSDSLLVVRWLEDGDSLALGVGTSGLPRWARIARPDGPALDVRYPAWSWVDGASWPTGVALSDGGGRFQVECRLRHVRFAARPDRRRLAVVTPADAGRLGWLGLRRALERLEEL